jgi:ribonuclease III
MFPQRAIETKLGHRFSEIRLLTEALTHRSHGTPHNERLEFLGDGVLNCVVAAELYRRYPQLSEGELSRLRAGLVNKNVLHEIAVNIDLGALVLLGNGELKSGGHSRPSILADALEALLGAVFLDSGYHGASAVVDKLFAHHYAQLDPSHIAKDHKTRLQEYLQGRKISVPKYEVLDTTGEAHEQIFRVACIIAALKIHAEGAGPSRKLAEQSAAAVAYEEIFHG